MTGTVAELIEQLRTEIAERQDLLAKLESLAPVVRAKAGRKKPKAKRKANAGRRPTEGAKRPRPGKEIQRLLGEGKGVKEVARLLKCAVSTVSYHAKKRDR